VKHAKTAALVAGSVVALGAASPAFAADATAGQHPNTAAMPQQKKAENHGAAEDALSGKQVGAGQAMPLVRSLTGGQKMPDKGKAVGQHNNIKQGKQSPQQQGKNNGSSPLGGLGSVTKGLPLLGGLPIG